VGLGHVVEFALDRALFVAGRDPEQAPRARRDRLDVDAGRRSARLAHPYDRLGIAQKNPHLAGGRRVPRERPPDAPDDVPVE
jgi:hypothetical protein